jgi:selenide,water dikinase
MALASGTAMEIVVEQVPVIEGALDAVRSGAIPAGLLANRSFAECISGDAPGSQIPNDLRTLLYDPQTAGGLLVSISNDESDGLLASLRSAGLRAARIGSVVGPYVPGRGAPAILLR